MSTPKAPSFEGKAVTTMSSLTAYVDEYLDDYELRADDGDYRPDEDEQMLITDAVYGLLGDECAVDLIVAHRLAVRALRIERKECPACGRANEHGHWGACVEQKATSS